MKAFYESKMFVKFYEIAKVFFILKTKLILMQIEFHKFEVFKL